MSLFDKLAQSILSKKGDDGAPLGPIEDPQDQTPEELALISHVREKIDQVRGTNSRLAQESTAFTNIAYLLGYSGVSFDARARAFKNADAKRPLARNTFKINKILPTVQNRLARLTQSPPKYDVRPESNDSKDKDCARLGLQVIEDIFEKQNFTEKQQDLLMNAMQAGVAYIQVMWDPTLGKPMVDPETNEFAGYEGDVRLEVLTMFEIFPDPLAKTVQDAQWIIKAKVRKLDYFKERYEERGHLVKEEDVWLQSSLYDLKANAATSVGIAGTTASDQMKNSAIELVYYEKRSKDYQNGRMVCMANGILLENKPLPIGEYDIVKFDDILIGGKYHSEALITHLRPIQDQYTINRTKCADWIKKTLAGKYIVAKGAGLSQEAINNETEIIEANPVPNWNGPVVQALTIPQIPSYVYEDTKVLSQEFDFTSGINEASRGVAPGAQMPFRGMALLVEQDQTRMSVQTNRNEIGYAKVGCYILKYAGKNYEIPRMLKEAGDGLGYAVKEFKGSDLGNNYDVIVIPGSTSPTSKVLNRQDIMNAYQSGLLGDPADPKLRAKVLKMQEFGDVSEMWKEQALDEQQIKKVILSIEDGTVDTSKPGHEWDNHTLFITEMNNYRKTDKFEEMSETQKAQFNYISEWHVQALVSLTQPQIPQAQMMAQHMVNTMHEQQQNGQFPQPGQETQQQIPGGGSMPPVSGPAQIGA